ncbi:MAG: DUF411 domain-containing protein [Gemmatimonadetes bacterium]|nr:DUF411 domain-containing protein [Gemmatimonadota bacterium]
MLSRRSFLSYAGGGAAVLLVARELRAAPTSSADAASARAKAVVYLSPACGCCADWVKHLKQNQFDVEVRTLEDVDPIKRQHKVPERLWACHTAVVDGVVVEGHVPADLITRVLRERPAGVAGLAVAGMPMGSPGMEHGDHKEPYDVLAFSGRGESKVFAKR